MEIEHLCKAFDAVSVYTIRAEPNPNAQLMLPLPQNATAKAIIKQDLPFPKRAFWTPRFWSMLLLECMKLMAPVRWRLTAYNLKSAIRYLMDGWAIAQNIKDLSPSNAIVYAYWNDASGLATALLAKEKEHIKGIARAHGYDLYEERHPGNYLPFRSFIYRHVHQMSFISNMGKTYASEHYRGHKDHFRVDRLGTVGPDAIATADHRKKAFVLWTCSNLIPLKRIELLIEALSLPRDQHIHWEHFGDGPLEIALKGMAAEKLDPLTTSWSFHGFVPNDMLMDRYRFDPPNAFCNLSTTEGLPVSIMEAMAHAVPCIATDVGGTSEIVHEQNGHLLPPNPTPQNVLHAILELAELTSDNYVTYRIHARNTWEAHYNAQKNYANFAGLLQKLSQE